MSSRIEHLPGAAVKYKALLQVPRRGGRRSQHPTYASPAAASTSPLTLHPPSHLIPTSSLLLLHLHIPYYHRGLPCLTTIHTSPPPPNLPASSREPLQRLTSPLASRPAALLLAASLPLLYSLPQSTHLDKTRQLPSLARILLSACPFANRRRLRHEVSLCRTNIHHTQAAPRPSPPPPPLPSPTPSRASIRARAHTPISQSSYHRLARRGALPMATATEGPYTSSLPADRPRDRIASRIIPLSHPSSAAAAAAAARMPSSSGDAMDVSPSHTPPANNGSPSAHNDYDSKPNSRSNNSPPQDGSSNSGNMAAPPPSAAGAAQQPKIVQTAFIHKLYKLALLLTLVAHARRLEHSTSDILVCYRRKLRHVAHRRLFESPLVRAPTLRPANRATDPRDTSLTPHSQYFKHTNISSFVRQLNMYGFHKERDVFHTGNPDTTLWEFKHGNGNFKRGDLAGLREIKRRASKQLGPKESTYVKASPSQPGTPAEPVLPPDSTEGRLAHLEHSLYDVSSRLHRSEEQAHYMQVRNQATMDTVNRLLQFNHDMSRMLLSLVPVDSPTHRDGMCNLNMKKHRLSLMSVD
ncbi:hypothetical protein PWT90_11110 [Aphanocladium album]|nr:hypothetical protein PWT90_11110 [Aphanocladium album]